MDQVVALSVMNDPELAQRALGYAVPNVLSKLAQSAADQGLTVDWTTFSLTVDAANAPFPETATIRTTTRTR